MQTPYNGLQIFVTVGNITYTAGQLRIKEMVVTDDDDGDNEIELTIPDDDYKITDSGIFKVGQIMSIQWGWSGGDMSQQRTGYVIMKPSVTYDESGVTAKITASTKSATLAARRPQKVSGPTSVRTIISDIANRNGLTLQISDGNERLSGFSHAALSDREVVRMLADRFGYQATYTSETLIFAPRDFGATPTIELLFRMGESSNILTADLEVDAKKSLGDNKTSAVSVDPNSKSVKQATAESAPKSLAISAEDGHSWTTTLMAKNVTIPAVQSQAFQLNNVSPALQADLQKIMSSPDSSEENLTSLASSEMQTKQKKKGELSITSTGFVTANSRLIVTVKGLAKRDSGNWYTCSVEHHISETSAYTCQWSLSRHGNNTRGTEKNTSPINNQQATITDKTKKAFVIDAETGAKLP